MITGRLPDFLVIGAMKAGTTTLFRHLQQHPRIYMPDTKEPDFFVVEKNWRRGFDWYSSLFDAAPADAVLGEGSTNYSKAGSFPGVPELLRKHVPDVKIVYLLRDPIARMRSHYVHATLSGAERRAPADAFDPSSGYVDTSCYGAQLERYLEHFSREQILVVQTENMRDDPVALLDTVGRFLGLEPFDFPELSRREHASDQRRATRRLGAMVRRNQRLMGFARDVLPDSVRASVRRGLTRSTDAAQVDVPLSAFAHVRAALTADRDLLLQSWPMNVDKWQPLSEIPAELPAGDS